MNYLRKAPKFVQYFWKIRGKIMPEIEKGERCDDLEKVYCEIMCFISYSP